MVLGLPVSTFLVIITIAATSIAIGLGFALTFKDDETWKMFG